MTDSEAHIFYSSKRHVIHLAINIAFAPVLLYLVGLWAWPPILPHYLVFAIALALAFKYSRRRLTVPRLVLDERGLQSDQFYPAENIYRAESSYRSVSLTLLTEGKMQTKVIGLGWANREDCETIQQLLTQRFNRELPESK